jgi:hypothetical protein
MSTRPTKALEASAYHEAGHAVAAYWFKRSFRHVSIAPSQDNLGHVLFADFSKGFRPDLERTPAVIRQAERNALISLAGPAAERISTGRNDHHGARGDYSNAADMLNYLAGSDNELNAYLELIRVRAADFVKLPWITCAIEALVDGLLSRRTLGSASARNIIKQAIDDCHVPARMSPFVR